MSVKLALLKSGESVIAETKELISDDKVCGYLFENPQVVFTENSVMFLEENVDHDQSKIAVTMKPWIDLTSDTKIPVPPDWIITIVEPIDSVRKLYEEKVNGKDNQSFVTD
jgi:hypothetical protein